MSIDNFSKETLDLINRQRAENERLNVELKAMRGAANSYKLEYNRLLQKLQQAKSKAIKEFAKFIIDKSENGIIRNMDIPDYVKEMMEVKENEKQQR